MISKVISGGQTGVDQAALLAARRCGVPTGGWAARGWETEDGPAPWLSRYNLQENPVAGYTKRNVMESDATILFVLDYSELRSGTRLTRDVCAELGRPHALIDLSNDPAEYAFWWLRFQVGLRHLVAGDIELNAAGPRESKSPGIGEKAERFLVELFTKLGFSEK